MTINMSKSKDDTSELREAMKTLGMKEGFDVGLVERAAERPGIDRALDPPDQVRELVGLLSGWPVRVVAGAFRSSRCCLLGLLAVLGCNE